MKEYISDLQQKDKLERVIDVITPQFSSIKQMKKKIYNLNRLSVGPNFEVCLKETITFSNGELILNEEARITPIVLKVGMTKERVDKCGVK